MVREIVRDVFFLGQKSEPATKQDISVGQDLMDTLKANQESKTRYLIQFNDCPFRGVASGLGVSVLQTGAFLYIGDVKDADHHKKNGRI